MSSQGNFRDQVIAVVPAGSVILLHYDIWHAGTANTSDRVRYMMKFLFDRISESTKPSWNHNPSQIFAVRERLENEAAATVQRSLVDKQRYLRRQMWNNLAGQDLVPSDYFDRWAGAWPGDVDESKALTRSGR